MPAERFLCDELPQPWVPFCCLLRGLREKPQNSTPRLGQIGGTFLSACDNCVLRLFARPLVINCRCQADGCVNRDARPGLVSLPGLRQELANTIRETFR